MKSSPDGNPRQSPHSRDRRREGEQTLITIILVLVVAHGLPLTLGSAALFSGLVVVAAAASVVHHAFGLLEEIHCCCCGFMELEFLFGVFG
jgi:hypothetical protein